MAKRPPASSVSVDVSGGPFGSLEVAVSPTRLPSAAPSATVLAPALPSTGADGATSLTAMVKIDELVDRATTGLYSGQMWMACASLFCSVTSATVTTPV